MQRRQRGRRETVARLVENASARRPRLLVVEDVHWADRPDARAAGEPRPDGRGRAGAAGHDLARRGRPARSGLAGGDRRRRRCSPSTSGRCAPNEAEQLAGAYLEASSEFARRCLERAAGNPLFLEQLLRHAEERAGSGVPGSVQSLVQARMDQLEPIDKQALLAASVFGQRFALAALRHLIERPDYACAAAGRAPAGAPRGRRLPVRPRADPGCGLRHAAQVQPPPAAPAGGGLVRGPRPGAVRRASGAGRGRGRGAPPISKPPDARRPPIVTSRRWPWSSVASRSRPRRPTARR